MQILKTREFALGGVELVELSTDWHGWNYALRRYVHDGARWGWNPGKCYHSTTNFTSLADATSTFERAKDYDPAPFVELTKRMSDA